MQKIQSFQDLIAWQKGHRIVLAIYSITRTFPKEEQYGITSQMRRSAISITSNIAEGFSRRTPNDKRHFYTIAIASLTEVHNQLLASRDICYLSDAHFNDIEPLMIEAHKVLNGLISSVRTRSNTISTANF